MFGILVHATLIKKHFLADRPNFESLTENCDFQVKKLFSVLAEHVMRTKHLKTWRQTYWTT